MPRVHPLVADFLEQLDRVNERRRRDDEARDLLEEGLALARAGKTKQAAAKLRQAQKLQKN